MPLSIFAQSMREARRPLLHHPLLLAGAVWLIVLTHPLLLWVFGPQALSEDLPAWARILFDIPGSKLPAGMTGWFVSVGFGVIIPLLAIFLAARYGSRLIAGEEERGSLSLLLSTPLTRSRLVLEKFAVLLLLVSVMSAGLWVSVLLAKWVGLLPDTVAFLARAVFAVFLLTIAFATLAFGIGALTGRQTFSLLIVLGVALLTLLIARLPEVLPGQVILRLFSPFYYYMEAMVGSLFLLHTLALTVFSAAAFTFTWLAFNHRDLPV